MSAKVNILLGIAAGLVVLIGLGYLGLQVKPRNLPLPDTTSRDLGTVPLPTDLPAPVYRHFEQVLGTQVPIVESAVVWGSPRIRVNGVPMRMRHVTVYTPGQYARRMDTTWFSLPILRGREWYLEGKGRQEMAGGVTEGMETDQAACLGAWAENFVLPSVYITTPGVRWEAVDETTARLIVPCSTGDETFTVEFDPDSGLMRRLTVMRYQQPGAPKRLWILDILEWEIRDGMPVPVRSTATWDQDSKPWLYWEFDGLAYNIDVTGWMPPPPIQ